MFLFMENLKFLLKIKDSRSLMFFKIAVLKNFVIFTRKHLSWSLFLPKLQAFRPATLLNRLQHGCFPVNKAIFTRKLSHCVAVIYCILSSVSTTLSTQPQPSFVFLQSETDSSNKWDKTRSCKHESHEGVSLLVKLTNI